MKAESVRNGMNVITAHAFKANATEGMSVHLRHLGARRTSTRGVTDGYVPGHGGEVWWVKHEDGSVGAYSYSELNAAGDDRRGPE